MVTDRQTDRQTERQNDYYNPRCACAPRVNNIGITYTITEGGADKGSNVGGIAGGSIVAIIAVLAIVGSVHCSLVPKIAKITELSAPNLLRWFIMCCIFIIHS